MGGDIFPGLAGLDTGESIGVPSCMLPGEAIEGPEREEISASSRVGVAIGVPSRTVSCELVGALSCKSANGNPSRRIGDNPACSAVRLEAPKARRFQQSKQSAVSLLHDEMEEIFLEIN